MLTKNKKIKKILAILAILITLFSIAQPALAASGTGTWVGGHFASYLVTAEEYNSGYGILIRRLVNLSTYEKITVFCAENGVDFETGVAISGSYYTPTNEKVKKACKVAYFGWYKEYGDYVVSGDMTTQARKDYVFTQMYIWEMLEGGTETFVDSSLKKEYESFKASIDTQIENMGRQPSFSGTTVSIEDESITLTDTNGVLSSYNSINVTKEGITFVHNKGENTLTISISDSCTLESYRISNDMFEEWGLIKAGTEDNDTTIYFDFDDKNTQNQLYALNYNDPVSMSLELQISLYGNLELSKLNTNGDLVDGAIFEVTSDNGYSNTVTVTNGKITLDKLKVGTYYIKETNAPMRIYIKYRNI